MDVAICFIVSPVSLKPVYMKFPAFCFLTIALFLHTTTFSQSDSISKNYLKVYLDGAYFYQDHIKTEIPYLNYMRDRFDAQVHLLIAQQQTGSGGTDYTIFFLGKKEFEGKNDTLHFIANTNNTEDETREGIVQILKMGLMPYIARLPVPTKIDISFKADTTVNEEKQLEDKWNGWVYSISSYANMSISKYYKSYNVSGNLSANKITDEWKLSFSAGGNFNTDIYDFDDGTIDEYQNNSKYGDATIVSSINNHWSAGGEASYSSSTYSNYDLSLTLRPAIEYDVFPYSESTTKLLTFFYTIGPEYAIYTDTTIYDLKEEFLLQQRLDISLSLKQKWGSVVLGLNGSNYFHDLSKNRAGCFASINWRIYEGLSLNGYFALDFIQDQLNLPKGGATEEEILLQISELETDFSFYTFFGISYTFGSIFNNVVNPRFDSGNTFYF